MKYLVRVKTKNVSFAGTDRDVYLVLVGDKMEGGKHKEAKFEITELIPGNALERNADEEFVVECDDLGKIIKIRLSKDKTDDWECDFIEVTRTPESRFIVNSCITGSGTKEFYIQ